MVLFRQLSVLCFDGTVVSAGPKPKKREVLLPIAHGLVAGTEGLRAERTTESVAARQTSVFVHLSLCDLTLSGTNWAESGRKLEFKAHPHCEI